MEKDTKVIVISFLILLVAIVSFSFNRETTSEVVQDITDKVVTNVVPDNVALYYQCEASSQYSASYDCNKARDANPNSDWAIASSSKGYVYQTNQWIKSKFAAPKTINKIILKARMCKACGTISKGKLVFSDGSVIENINVPYGRSAPQGVTVNFDSKTVTWVKLEMQQTYGANPGLSEFEIYSAQSSFNANKIVPITSCAAVSGRYNINQVIMGSPIYWPAIVNALNCNLAYDNAIATGFALGRLPTSTGSSATTSCTVMGVFNFPSNNIDKIYIKPSTYFNNAFLYYGNDPVPQTIGNLAVPSSVGQWHEIKVDRDNINKIKVKWTPGGTGFGSSSEAKCHSTGLFELKILKK